MSDLLAGLDRHLAQAGLLVAALGLWLGALTWSRPGRALDRVAFRAVNRLPALAELDWLMWTITHLGSAWAGMAALGLAILADRARFGLVMALALLSMGIVIGVTKSLTQRARPFAALPSVRVIGLRPADLSYPSGHATMAFNLATLLSLGLPLAWPLRVLLYALAALVGYSRVHLGVHYPLDVISGATFGTGWGLVWVSVLR